MRKARIYVSKEFIARALFDGQVAVLDVAPGGDSYIEMTIEGAPVPETPDAAEPPKALAIISLTAPAEPPRFVIRLLDDN
jgi:hypothetical protein